MDRDKVLFVLCCFKVVIWRFLTTRSLLHCWPSQSIRGLRQSTNLPECALSEWASSRVGEQSTGTLCSQTHRSLPHYHRCWKENCSFSVRPESGTVKFICASLWKRWCWKPDTVKTAFWLCSGYCLWTNAYWKVSFVDNACHLTEQ